MTSAVASGRRQRYRDMFTWLAGYSFVFGAGLVVAAFAFRRFYQPYIGVALAGLILVVCGWSFRPRHTLNATLFFALIGDIVTIGWFPFNKNLSSRESILFISDSLSLSPLELVLFAGIGIVATQRVASGNRVVVMGAVGRPMLLFVVFVFLGLFVGLFRGGDFRVAMFEMRPLLYLPLVYFLAVALCTEPKHHRQLVWSAFAAVYVQSLLSLLYLMRLDASSRDSLESLTEHGSVMGMNLLIIFTVISLAFRKISVLQRCIFAFVLAPPVIIVYLVSQRRAGIITLGVAVILLLVVLFWRQRRTFWKLFPAVLLITIGYTGAFWNSESTVGFPAQAIKSVVAPGDISAKDQSSDQYRVLENLNVNATIRAAPVTGLGFGQKFYRPYPLPDISAFEFNAYLPHNSLLWIWIKTGFFGFLTMIYLLGRTVLLGGSKIRELRHGPDLAVTTAATIFVVMYTIYAYVDIAWGSRNMVMLGAAIAIVTTQFGADDAADTIEPDREAVLARPRRDQASKHVPSQSSLHP